MIMSSHLRPPRLRADQLLVERGLFESRAKAQTAIAAGAVLAPGAARPCTRLAGDRRRRGAAAAPAHPFVSRGGVKLARARAFASIRRTASASMSALRPAASPRCCSARRAARLRGRCRPRPASPRLRRDRGRLDWRRPTSARSTRHGRRAADLVVIDVSFISLRLVLPAALALAAVPAELVALIKPQFEAGRAQ